MFCNNYTQSNAQSIVFEKNTTKKKKKKSVNDVHHRKTGRVAGSASIRHKCTDKMQNKVYCDKNSKNEENRLN